MKYIVVFCRYYFGLHCFASGANYFLHFSQTGVMTDPVNAQFMTAITTIGLYAGVKTVELIAGVLILSGFLIPLGLVLEFPVSVIICVLSTYEGIPIHVVTGFKELILNTFLFAAYAGYYLPLLTVKTRQRPVWAQPQLDWLLKGRFFNDQI